MVLLPGWNYEPVLFKMHINEDPRESGQHFIVVVPGLSCNSDVKIKEGVFSRSDTSQDNDKPLQSDQTICSYFLPTYRSDTRVFLR